MQSFNLNLVPGSFQQVFNCSQGDIGRQLTAKLFDGSTEYAIPAGSTVKIKATKPSGFGFDESATFSGSTVTITTVETMTNEWGRFPAELVITKDGNVIGTANFLFNIEKNPHPDSTVDGDAEEVIPELTLLVERVEAAASSVLDMEVVATTLPAGSQASYSYDEDLNKATFGIPQGEAGAGAAGVVASAYSSSKTYKVGDYVLHNSNLYRCITAITTAEAFTAAHWAQIVLADDVSDLKSDFNNVVDLTGYTWAIGSFDAYGNEAVSTARLRSGFIPVTEGTKIKISVANCLNGVCYDKNKRFVNNMPAWSTTYTIPSGVAFFRFMIRKNTSDSTITSSDIDDLVAECSMEYKLPQSVITIEPRVSILEDDYSYLDSKVLVLRNGTLANSANSSAISMSEVMKIPEDKKVKIEYTGELPNGYHLLYQYATYTNSARGLDPYTAIPYRVAYNTDNPLKANETTIDLSPLFEAIGDTEKYFAIALAMFKPNGSAENLRIATHGNTLYYRRMYGDTEWDYRNADNAESKHLLLNSRQIPQFAGTPLTILHFSDIHKEKNTLRRIMNDANKIVNYIDGYICTGDMVGNTAEQISSWWDQKVMTCIGNHDSASYDADTGYDWTALSMANRDAYYIAPFESNWGITHTSGTSYYYKDYATQKVRLIVMDGMLYTDNGAEATAQTSWLANLLSDAITNSYHVLIAIHAPHGGSSPVDCSFTKADETTMPTRADCNTPQAVIDAVATAINNGLKFIGYLCGHVHQDDIWDAENDGTQLMYSITCAGVNSQLWWYSDQYRSVNDDAFNIVTIDTVNTLVKIVRGGGANVDCNGRNRKYICFNYSTGEVVGEVL